VQQKHILPNNFAKTLTIGGVARHRHSVDAVFVELAREFRSLPNLCLLCRFEICRKLGQGTYGKVQLGINKETGQQVTFNGSQGDHIGRIFAQYG
jgi:serine/threonine protein kinase